MRWTPSYIIKETSLKTSLERNILFISTCKCQYLPLSFFVFHYSPLRILDPFAAQSTIKDLQ